MIKARHKLNRNKQPNAIKRRLKSYWDILKGVRHQIQKAIILLWLALGRPLTEQCLQFWSTHEERHSQAAVHPEESSEEDESFGQQDL